MHKIKIEKFEGPLDLLLQLIEQQKLDIAEVSLARVTEQYISFIQDAAKKISLDEVADFLVIASRLLLLKSRILLPYLQLQPEEDEGKDLESQLKIYKKFHDASIVIQKIISKRNFAYSRLKIMTINEVEFRPPKNLTAKKMAAVFADVVDKLEPIMRLPQSFIRKSINITERLNQIREQIFSHSVINFKVLTAKAKDKTDIIVSFLALLELVKQRVVIVQQSGVFSDIEIKRAKKRSSIAT